MNASRQDRLSLDDLRKLPEPAFLWDGGRNKIVWSNQAGLAFFAAETLFDLIDRSFSAAEHGVSRIAELTRELKPGTASNENLFFPSAALMNGAILCTCHRQRLPDGRDGILMVGKSSAGSDAPLPSDRQILDALPQALLLVLPSGDIVLMNVAAADLFDQTDDTDLGMLLGDQELSRKIIQRALVAGSFSQVQSISVRYGRRDFRLHAQALGESDQRHILLIMEDITDRRILERRLREHAEHLSEFVSSTPDSTWELDRELRFSHVSDEFAAITGMDAEHIVGASWADISRQYALDPGAKIARLMDEQSAWKVEVSWGGQAEQASPVKLILSAVPVFQADGTFSGYRGIGAKIAGQSPSPEAPAISSMTTSRGLGEPAEALSEEEKVAFAELGEVIASNSLDCEDVESKPDLVSGELEQKIGNLDGLSHSLAPTLENLPGEVPDDVKQNNISAKDSDAGIKVAISAVKAVIDGFCNAIVVHRDGELLHLNPCAATLLGLENREQAFATGTLRDLFGVYTDDLLEARGTPVVLAGIPHQSGSTHLSVSAQPAVIAWPGGDAVQITLEPVLAAGEDETELSLPENVVRLVRDEINAGQVTSGGPTNADLLAMLNTATDGILTLDHTGKILSSNAGAEAMLGYETEEVTGRSLADFLNLASRDVFERYMNSFFDTGIASLLNDGREVTGIEKNGGEIPLFLTLGRLDGSVGGDGEKLRLCAVLRDLTSWKKTEAELVHAREAAEQASAQKSEFLANISHEIRTPLNAILGFSEVMKARRFGEINNDKYSGYVDDIHSSGEHLLSLINDLLDLSKVEAGKLELNFASIDLGEIIAQCIGVLAESATNARVIVRSSVLDGLPNVVADQRSMRQIMLNLLSNAIKFTEFGGQVLISARLEPAGHVSLKIKDTGRGMTDEQVEHAMEPFRQVEEVANEGMPGTGLGLPLTKALAEANRASFAISSKPEVGTVVEITFPTTRVLA